MQGGPLDTFEERMCLYLSPSLMAIATSLGWVLAQQLHSVNVVLFLSHFGQVPAFKTFAAKSSYFKKEGSSHRDGRERESAPKREKQDMSEGVREKKHERGGGDQRGHEKKHREDIKDITVRRHRETGHHR